uniref:F-box domain-containing protein n=1 Tax=Caenorhabditis tropicalis TaxID=1561998 RepID=A0A1I7TKY8_9PELO
MTFPLLKLPFLAYEQVLLNFEVPDLVDFSFCSSRCHRIVQSIRFPFSGLRVDVDCRLITLWFFEGITQWHFKPRLCKKISDTENGWRRIGRNRIRIQKEPEWCSTLKNIKVAFDYVQDLFRLPVISYHIFNDRNLFPQWFGITKCEYFSIGSENKRVSNDKLKYALETMEISGELALFMKKNDDFECGFVQFSMDVLRIFQAFWITNETFLAMDCARIELHGNGNLPIREFVSQWLSSRNTRFKWLKMTYREQINWNDGFKTMKWNPRTRGRNFQIECYYRVDCENGIDFLREDGLLASIVEKQSMIYFVVWHKRFQPEADNFYLDEIEPDFL